MTFLELVQRTWQKCGLAGAGPTSVTSQTGMSDRLIQYVADAYQFVQLQHTTWKFHWRRKSDATFTLLTSRYFPGDFGINDLRAVDRMLVLVDGRWAPITLVTDASRISEYDNIIAEPGVPRSAFLLPTGEMQFDRVPDVEYPLCIEYYRTVHPLLTNTDVPLIPEEYQWTIIWKAIQYYAAFDEDVAMGNEAFREYSPLLLRLEANQLPPMRFPESSYA